MVLWGRLTTSILVVRRQAAARVGHRPLANSAGQHSCVCCWSCFSWAKVSRLLASFRDRPKSCHLPNNEDQRPLIRTPLFSLPVALCPLGRCVNAPLRGRACDFGGGGGGDQPPHSSARSIPSYGDTHVADWKQRPAAETDTKQDPPPSPPPAH